ncbi:unnamed protein product, partial [Sphacelaria rigidula]
IWSLRALTRDPDQHCLGAWRGGGIRRMLSGLSGAGGMQAWSGLARAPRRRGRAPCRVSPRQRKQSPLRRGTAWRDLALAYRGRWASRRYPPALLKASEVPACRLRLAGSMSVLATMPWAGHTPWPPRQSEACRMHYREIAASRRRPSRLDRCPTRRRSMKRRAAVAARCVFASLLGRLDDLKSG